MMNLQLDLLTLPPVDTHVLKPAEIKRLSGQNLAILTRLQAGPASNFELAQIALKYTSRLSDLRAAGYDVRVVERDYASGLTMYRLEH
jgi:hypothetical protein